MTSNQAPWLLALTLGWLMAGAPVASDPFIVGRSERSAAAAGIANAIGLAD